MKELPVLPPPDQEMPCPGCPGRVMLWGNRVGHSLPPCEWFRRALPATIKKQFPKKQ